MATMQSSALTDGFSLPQVRHITGADLDWALAEGWKDFNAKRGDLLVLALIYPLVGVITAAVAFDDRLLPMLFPLVAGMSILGPAVASGFYELARRREAGLESSWRHFVDPLSGRARTQLGFLTAGLVVIFAAWLVCASAIYAATIGGNGSDMGASEFLSRVFTTPQGWAMIVFGNLVGFGFAVLTLVLTLVSFPMIVDKPVGARAAVMTSIHAVSSNPGAVAAWGLRIAALLVLGCLPVFIGLAVVLPVLGYATWHLYTQLVER